MPKIAEIDASDTRERTEMNPLTRPAGIWLHCAAAGLFVLASAAAVVSFSAQYRLVFAARGSRSRPRWRPRFPMLPPWSSPAWAWRWRCTAVMPSAPGC
jgi:hypothetical protein